MVCESPIKRGPNKGKLAKGTVAGYTRHCRISEPACSNCLTAHDEANAIWAANNPEKVKKKNRRLRERNKKVRDVQIRIWQQNNKERIRETVGKWRQANIERIRAREQQWYLDNREKIREQNRIWQQQNPEKNREKTRRYNAHKKGALTIPFTPEQLKQRMSMFGNRCWLRIHCNGAPREAVDHVISLSKGGPHCLSNLRPACTPCNSAKLNRDWREFLPESFLPPITSD